VKGTTSVFKISKEEIRNFLGNTRVRSQQEKKSIFFFFKTSRPVLVLADSSIVGGQIFSLELEQPEGESDHLP
jgi:hypothetical protein